jgi:hypothetical protein
MDKATKIAELKKQIKMLEDTPTQPHEFNVGDWITDGDTVCKITRIKNSSTVGWKAFGARTDENTGYSTHWCDDNTFMSDKDSWRLATKREIGGMLVKEAKKRGIYDVPLKAHAEGTVTSSSCHIDNKIPLYAKGEDELWSTYGVVYRNGKWAEASTPILGYDIEVSPDTVKIGCKVFKREDFRTFTSLCKEVGIERIKTTYGKVKISELDNILKRL